MSVPSSLGTFKKILQTESPQIFYINLLGINFVFLVYFTEKYEVLVESVLGTRTYSFYTLHLDRGHDVFDALKIAYTNYFYDLIPSQASIDFENGFPLDKVLKMKEKAKKVNFFTKTFQKLRMQIETRKTDSIFTEISHTLSSDISFRDLQKEYSNVLENFKNKRDDFEFNQIRKQFRVIQPIDMKDIDENLQENHLSVVVLTDEESDRFLVELNEKNQNLVTSVFGTHLETQDLKFLTSSTVQKETEIEVKRRPSKERFIECLIEFINTQVNYQDLIENFYDFVIEPAKNIKDNTNLERVCQDYKEVIESERNILFYIIKLFNLENCPEIERAKRNLYETDEEFILALTVPRKTKDKGTERMNKQQVDLQKIKETQKIAKFTELFGQDLSENDEQLSLVGILNKMNQKDDLEKLFTKLIDFFFYYTDKMTCFNSFFQLYNTYDISEDCKMNNIDVSRIKGGFTNLFIQPIQRLVRYKQFFEKFYEFGSKESDLTTLKKTILKLTNFLKKLNGDRFIFESGRKAFDIQKKVEKCPHSILNVKRAFAKQLHGVVADKFKISVFLYNDLMMFASRNKKSLDIFKNDDTKYKFIKTVPIQHIRIIKITENEFKFCLTEKETEKNINHVPGSLVIQSGDDIFSIFDMAIESEYPCYFLKEFFIYKNNDISLKNNTKIFLRESPDFFIFFHLKRYEDGDASKYKYIVNLTNNEIVPKVTLAKNAIQKSTASFLGKRDQLFFNLIILNSNEEAEDLEKELPQSVEIQAKSNKNAEVQIYKIETQNFTENFTEYILDAVKTHNTSFPLSKESSSALKCNMTILEKMKKYKINFSSYDPIQIGLESLSVIYQASKEIEALFKLYVKNELAEGATQFKKFVETKELYRIIDIKILKKNLKRKKEESKRNQAIEIQRKTDIFASFWKYAIYDIFEYEQIEKLHEEIQSETYEPLQVENDRKIFFKVFFGHLQVVDQLFGSNLIIHMIQHFFIGYSQLENHKIQNWLQFIFKSINDSSKSTN